MVRVWLASCADGVAALRFLSDSGDWGSRKEDCSSKIGILAKVGERGVKGRDCRIVNIPRQAKMAIKMVAGPPKAIFLLVAMVMMTVNAKTSNAAKLIHCCANHVAPP